MQGEDKCAKKQKLNQVLVEQHISELISSALTIMTLVSILHCTISCWLDTPLNCYTRNCEMFFTVGS